MILALGAGGGRSWSVVAALSASFMINGIMSIMSDIFVFRPHDH
jgi:hypothetical protein